MELQLRTLTPLHIGDGSQLHSFDYVLHSGQYYRVSQQKFSQFIEWADQNDPAQQCANAFADWAADMSEKIENVERDRRNASRQGGRDFNQELSRLRSQYNLMAFAKTINKDTSFLDFLKKQVRPLPLMMEGSRPKQEIRGFIRDGNGQPYLPGSSIKGCIRTALLYHFLTEHADHAQVRESLSSQVARIKRDKQEAEIKRNRFSIDRHRKLFGEDIEQMAFFAEMVTERGQSRKGEAQNDLMRCLLVSDVALPDTALCIDNIDLYLVKKMPKGQGNQAQRQSQSPAVEALVPNHTLNIQLGFNLDLLLHLHRTPADGDGLKVNNEKHFIGWRDKARWLFGLDAADFNTVPKGIRPTDQRHKALTDKALQHILACVQRFSDAQAAAYQNWQTHFAKPDHRGGNDARNVSAGASSISVNGLRLHLGFATGFEGMTEVLYLLREHKRLFAEVMELFGIGDSPSAWKNRKPGETYHANPDQFPKSRRLVSRPTATLPLGWLAASDATAAQGQSWTDSKSAHDTATVAPITPTYLRGSLKIGAEINAELLTEGNPGRFKLFIRTDYEPTVEVKYPAGFKSEDVGRIALLRIKNLKGKEEVLAVEFLRFR